MPYNWGEMELDSLLSHQEQLGYEAGAQGLELRHNPNTQGTKEYRAW